MNYYGDRDRHVAAPATQGGPMTTTPDIKALLEALLAVEWVYHGEDQPAHCAWCFSTQEEGHDADCARQAALAALEAVAALQEQLTEMTEERDVLRATFAAMGWSSQKMDEERDRAIRQGLADRAAGNVSPETAQPGAQMAMGGLL